MKLKTSHRAIAATLATLALSGCISTPRQQQAEIEAQRFATLRVHPDNRVGMKTEREWMWTTDASKILAIEVGHRVHNLKDVAAIVMDTDASLSLNMVNGEVKRGDVKSARWLSCTERKVCDREVPVSSGRNWQANLGDHLKHIPGSVLRDPASFKWGRTDMPDDPRKAIRMDSAAAPQLHRAGERVTVLSQAELDTLNARVASIISAWDAKAPERAAAQRERELEAAAVAQRRKAAILNARVGTSWHCERVAGGELPRSAGLACPNAENGASYSINDFIEAGWNVENIATNTVHDGLGRPFTRYAVSVRKAR